MNNNRVFFKNGKRKVFSLDKIKPNENSNKSVIETRQTNDTQETNSPLTTYIGKKGYTLLKEELSPDAKKKLLNKLNVLPKTGFVGASNTATYPVYRESNKKYYIPRYFGLETFGTPKENNIPEGTTIGLSFSGDMRDSQKPIIDAFMKTLEKNPDGFCGLLELPCAAGKTVLSLKIIEILKKKTLVIVNKEFLLNQWMERINQFLPGASVGIIQGQVVDVENRDIVIGMLQSLSMKTYPDEVFEGFGLTIIDECHHISSEVFSCVLFKIVTKFMIGLSATMERKDGTTYVIKMFLGDVIYSGKRDEGYDVVVRAIMYSPASSWLEDDDEEDTEDTEDTRIDESNYRKTEYDFRGNPQYSKMIVKICSYGPRSDFVIRILEDLIKEDSSNQIMVLAQNRSLLAYLYEKMEHRGFTSFGYYVGGMKQKDLDISSTKQVILATFSMAAEALDIKTLGVLVMATPKVDIEQSVGRILRTKDKKKIIVDIYDQHKLFQNQWLKRKTYYKKCDYLIKGTNSTKYVSMDDTGPEWVSIHNPKQKNTCRKDYDKKEPPKCLIQFDGDDVF